MGKKCCTLVFTGDIGFDRYMDKRWECSDLLSPAIVDFCRSADHVVANVEGALINAVDDGSKGIFFHNMDPAAVCVLENIHADIWNIANNHTMDAGKDGLLSTLNIAKEKNCRTVGAGIDETAASEPLYLDEAGGIGMIGVGYQPGCVPAGDEKPGVFRWDNFERIGERIAEVKSKCRWCIVISHGGEEFTDMPSPYTRDRYLKYLELGADIVVGHHPHVPENYELFNNGKAIFYSLSNFIFDTDYQRAHPYTDTGMLLKLTLTERGMFVDAMGTKIIRGEQKIVNGPVPAIFTNVPAKEYELLAPLAAKVFLAEEKKRKVFMKPETYTNADEAVWNEYFNDTTQKAYVKGEHMDFTVLVPFAAKAEEGKWKESKLTEVVKYMLERPEK